jgi:hypothetical protein
MDDAWDGSRDDSTEGNGNEVDFLLGGRGCV